MANPEHKRRIRASPGLAALTHSSQEAAGGALTAKQAPTGLAEPLLVQGYGGIRGQNRIGMNPRKTTIGTQFCFDL
jgi:hypothetical protein